MQRPHIHWIRFIGGLLWLAFGVFWALQGLGVIHGSAMSGHPIWLIIGVLVGIVGLWLIRLGLGERR